MIKTTFVAIVVAWLPIGMHVNSIANVRARARTHTVRTQQRTQQVTQQGTQYDCED